MKTRPFICECGFTAKTMGGLKNHRRGANHDARMLQKDLLPGEASINEIYCWAFLASQLPYRVLRRRRATVVAVPAWITNRDLCRLQAPIAEGVIILLSKSTPFQLLLSKTTNQPPGDIMAALVVRLRDLVDQRRTFGQEWQSDAFQAGCDCLIEKIISQETVKLI